jgi:hypothetical protein
MPDNPRSPFSPGVPGIDVNACAADRPKQERKHCNEFLYNRNLYSYLVLLLDLEDLVDQEYLFEKKKKHDQTKY